MQAFMKKAITAAAAMCTLVTGAHAFENEPTGFRGITWGTKVGDIQRLYQIHSLTFNQAASAAGTLFGLPAGVRPESLLASGVTAFVKTDEPLELAQSPLQSLRYIFSDGELVAVVGAYVDQAPPANLMAPRGPSVNAKDKVLAALKERFGAPTDPKTLKAVLFDKTDRTTYMGATALVVNECDKRTRQCLVGFASSPGWIKLTERLAPSAPGAAKATGF